jgi:hypothetical protein
MQRIALVIPPVAIILQLLPRGASGQSVLSLAQMLVLLVGAVCLFWIGRLVEGYSR